MSPQFAQHLDPIFLRVLGVIDSINAGSQPSAEQTQRLLNDQFRRAERQLSRTHGEAWDLAKFALTSWIDETMTGMASWDGQKWWMTNSLTWQHYKSAEYHTDFFVRARDAAEMPDVDDALETYYVCVMLGFRGLYGDTAEQDAEGLRMATVRYNLPPDLETWSSWVSTVVKERGAARAAKKSADPRERTIRTARPVWRTTSLLWPWLLAVLLFGLFCDLAIQRGLFDDFLRAIVG